MLDVYRSPDESNFPNSVRVAIVVIPAQAGNQNNWDNWFPACAGMT
jgi:hypothetical protein